MGAGRRTAEIMEVPKHWDATHFLGRTRADRVFVYCPVGNIVSWNGADWREAWCEFCKKSFAELKPSDEVGV